MEWREDQFFCLFFFSEPVTMFQMRGPGAVFWDGETRDRKQDEFTYGGK